LPDTFVPHTHPTATATPSRFLPSDVNADAKAVQFRVDTADQPPTVVTFRPAPVGGVGVVDRAASESAHA